MKIKINNITITVDETKYNSDWCKKDIFNEISGTIHEYSEHCDYDFEETKNMLIEDYCHSDIISEEDINNLCETLRR